AGRHREPAAEHLAESRALAAEARRVARAQVGQRGGVHQPAATWSFRIVTTPVEPSTCSSWPVLIVAVARPVPTTAGFPYSRDTIAACDMTPPMSVTVAFILGKIGAHAGDVIVQTRISPSSIVPINSGSLSTRAGPSATPADAAAPWSRCAPSSASAHSCSRAGVTPHSMTTIGSL